MNDTYKNFEQDCCHCMNTLAVKTETVELLDEYVHLVMFSHLDPGAIECKTAVLVHHVASEIDTEDRVTQLDHASGCLKLAASVFEMLELPGLAALMKKQAQNNAVAREQ